MEIGKLTSKPVVKEKGKPVISNSLEYYFEMWCIEAIQNSVITKYEMKPDPLILSEPVYRVDMIPYKRDSTKFRKKRVELLKGCQYEPDALVLYPDGKKVYYDIKPPAGSFQSSINSSYASFGIKRKWVYQKYKILVEKVVLFPVNEKFNSEKFLFTHTWTPQAYIDDNVYKRKTSNNKIGDSKIKLWKPRTVKEYIASL